MKPPQSNKLNLGPHTQTTSTTCSPEILSGENAMAAIERDAAADHARASAHESETRPMVPFAGVSGGPAPRLS